MRNDRDYLVLGDVVDQPAFAALRSALPITFDSNGIHAQENTSLEGSFRQLWRRLTGNLSQTTQPSNRGGRPDIVLEAMQSPSFPGRSVVVVAIRNAEAVDSFAETFLGRSQSSDISQTISLFRNGIFSSYTLDTSVYHVGSVSKYALLRIWCAQYFYILIGVVCLAGLLLASYIDEHLELLKQARLELETDTVTRPAQ